MKFAYVPEVLAEILTKRGVKDTTINLMIFDDFMMDTSRGVWFGGFDKDDYGGFDKLLEFKEAGIIELVDQTDVDNGVWVRVKKEIAIEYLKLVADFQEIEIIDMSDYLKQLDETYKAHDL